MSDPKQYTDLQVWEALHFGGSTNGWIRWEDYKRIVDRINEARLDAINVNTVLKAENARLKSEVERLRASSFVTAVPVEEYEKLKAERDAAKRCWDSMKEEWDKLVDENIRLRKAGDALQVAFLRLTSGTPNWDGKVYWNWHAAKEGKQP